MEQTVLHDCFQSIQLIWRKISLKMRFPGSVKNLFHASKKSYFQCHIRSVLDLSSEDIPMLEEMRDIGNKVSEGWKYLFTFLGEETEFKAVKHHLDVTVLGNISSYWYHNQRNYFHFTRSCLTAAATPPTPCCASTGRSTQWVTSTCTQYRPPIRWAAYRGEIQGLKRHGKWLFRLYFAITYCLSRDIFQSIECVSVLSWKSFGSFLVLLLPFEAQYMVLDHHKYSAQSFFHL